MIPEDKKESNISEQLWKPMRSEDVTTEIMDVLKIFVDEFPQLPIHAHKLLSLMSDNESDSREIAKIASSDPGVVSKILKAVNSTYYGLSKKTENLHLAITILGFNEVRQILLQSNFSKIFGEGWVYQGYDTRDLWEHAYLVSVCAEALGKSMKSHEIGNLLTFGILHDIGKYALYRLVVLMKKRGIKPYKSKTISKHSSLIEKEETLFGVNHTIIGSMLSIKWGLSERICAVLEYHHHPSFWGSDSIPSEYIKDVAMISISDFIIHLIVGKTKQLPEPAPEYFDILGLTYPVDTIITDALHVKIVKAREFIAQTK